MPRTEPTAQVIAGEARQLLVKGQRPQSLWADTGVELNAGMAELDNGPIAVVAYQV